MKRTILTFALLCIVQLLSFKFQDSCFTFRVQLSTVQAQEYKMAGPYEVVARDGEFRGSKNGSELDMKAAWDFAKAGKHDEARRIIDAYAEKLQRLDGHDAPLCLIQGYWLCRAMSLIPNPSPKERGAWEAMLRRAMVPTMNKFEADSPYANGNWGAIVNRFRMACALAIGDTVLYRSAIEYFLHANDNGSLPNYISETGQCQETGRDQNHAQLGLEALADICEMAWQQGIDLYGALDNRLMKGLEYTAKYNLGYDVPFERWTDCTGLYNDWTEPGEMGRGNLWAEAYVKPYEHYTKVKHLKMPYTKKVLDLRKKVKAHNANGEVRAPGVKEGARLHQVFAYPAPDGAPLKHDYDVYVCPRGSKEWTKIDTYMAKVNASLPLPPSQRRGTGHKISEISYCFFDFTGDVYVRVVTKNKKFKTARIRPDYRGTIANIQNDSTVQFLLFQPENVSVEFDGDITKNLLVFTSKPPVSKEEAEKQAKAQGRQFIYIPPGFYDQSSLLSQTPLLARGSGNREGGETSSGGDVLVPSNTTLYVDGGAYFTGTYLIKDAHDVSILGRGIARPVNGYNGCFVSRSQNVFVDGLLVCKCPIGGSNDVTLHDVRSITHPSWGDGLNVFSSQNVLMDRVFCRNSDDCTTAYATRLGFEGSTRNIHMRNSTLWADVAHPIFIGLHGAAAGPHPELRDTIENLVYENIDILCQAEPQVDYQGCLAINCGDNNLVRNILFDNIRIEQLHQGCILQVKVGWNQKYCKAPGLGVENVTFRNIRYYGEQPNLSVINGYNEERKVRNITFEGLKINGRAIYDDMPDKPKWYQTADCVPMFVGNHVEGLTFTKEVGQFNVNQQLSYCSRQVDRALEALVPYDFTMMPRNIETNPQPLPVRDGAGVGLWTLRKACPQEWCSGFWPGILWMDYSYNRSEAVRKAAESYTEAIVPIISQPVYDHDLGFIAINSFLKGYEQTKDERYKQLALQAADSLATLYNSKAGTLLSWPRHVKDYCGHNTIMDNMMNLELLFWASQENEKLKMRSEQLYEIAVRHAENTMKNQFRKDGSCYHVAIYDTLTGRFIKGVTHQGYSDESMWSRGQAWAIYGYTMVYRYTRDQRFLDHAKKVADIYLKRLKERQRVGDDTSGMTSDDWVPIWDMDAPEAQIVNGQSSNCKSKDASAACIVASALLELCRYVSDSETKMVNGKSVNSQYYDAAISMLRDLSTDRYQSRDKNVAFLMHSTGHHPAGSEIDASIVYADYYYLEALLRLKNLNYQ